MATAIMLKPNLRILAITPSRHLSPSPLPPLPNKNPFSDIKKNLKLSQPPSGHFDAISESLKNFRPNPQSSMRGFNLFPNRRNPETPTVGNLEKSKLPELVFGKELREKFGGVGEEAETGKLASTEFLKIYTHEEWGQKLKSLRPEDSRDGKNDWFSLEELNVRLSKLRELEQKEMDQKVHGLSLTDLTDSLKQITQRETMNRNKLAGQSMDRFANFNSLMTPNYTLNPPQEKLLDDHFPSYLYSYSWDTNGKARSAYEKFMNARTSMLQDTRRFELTVDEDNAIFDSIMDQSTRGRRSGFWNQLVDVDQRDSQKA